MSSGYWQTRRQRGQYANGLTLTQKIEAYCGTWEQRCYDGGIPDEVPRKLQVASRAPSYRAIAMCILKNDLHLRGLGFDAGESELCTELRRELARTQSPQLSMQLRGGEA